MQNATVVFVDEGVNAMGFVLVENILGGRGTPQTLCFGAKKHWYVNRLTMRSYNPLRLLEKVTDLFFHHEINGTRNKRDRSILMGDKVVKINLSPLFVTFVLTREDVEARAREASVRDVRGNSLRLSIRRTEIGFFEDAI